MVSEWGRLQDTLHDEFDRQGVTGVDVDKVIECIVNVRDFFPGLLAGAVPAAPGLDVERLARFGFEEHHRDQEGLTRTWEEAPDYSKNVWRRWAQSVLARLHPADPEEA